MLTKFNIKITRILNIVKNLSLKHPLAADQGLTAATAVSSTVRSFVVPGRVHTSSYVSPDIEVVLLSPADACITPASGARLPVLACP